MDMSSLFKGLAKTCFPKADIVADKYYVMRQGMWAFENVRKSEENKFLKVPSRLKFDTEAKIKSSESKRLATFKIKLLE